MNATKEQVQQEAVDRAVSGQTLSNYPAIIRGFMEKGIPADDIRPRENVFIYHAWRALGRQVRRGEHGVKVVTFVSTDRKADSAESEDGADLKGNAIDPVSKVCITTIQRPYSMLQGEDDFLEEADLVSTLAARLARLDRQLCSAQQAAVAKEAGGKEISALCSQLLTSIDADVNTQKAVAKFQLPARQEPSEQQLQQVEQEQMREALKPFHNPKLRNTILSARDSFQVIDESTGDHLLRAGFDATALEKARAMLTSFRQFIEDNKDEIEALKVLYSRPYRAGLRYGQVKELAAAIQKPPRQLHPERLWKAFESVEPDQAISVIYDNRLK